MIIDEYSIVAAIYSILLLIFAIAAPRVPKNAFFGIRIYATYTFPEVWKKTHKLFSLLCYLFFIPSILLIFFIGGSLRFTLINVCLLLPCFISAFYAGVIARPLFKEKKLREEEELREQLKREQQ